MGKSSQYNHYMQRTDISGQNVINLEEKDEGGFDNLRYLRADGMNDIGKAKNVYTEEYADADRKRYYLPDDKDLANECTKITMHFLVIGDAASRQSTIRAFFNYVRKGVHRYWDDARNLEFDFIVTDELKVSEERWHGSTPYVEIAVTMDNLNGKTRVHPS